MVRRDEENKEAIMKKEKKARIEMIWKAANHMKNMVW